MATPQIPRWITPAQSVRIRCTIKDSSRSDEFLVVVKANGDEYSLIVPSPFVDSDGGTIEALIIATVDGGILLDLPVETFSSGPRVRIPDNEVDNLIMR